MTTGFAGLNNDKNELIRKAVTGGVFVAPYTAAAITQATLFDAITGDLINPLPAGYKGLGRLTDAGVKLARAQKTSDITGWGTLDPVRSDITSDTSTIVIEPQESNQQTLALYTGVALSSIVPDPVNGSIQIDQPDIPFLSYMRVLVLAVDETTYGEYVMAKFFPYALATARADQIFANLAAATTYGVTIQAYLDSILGTAVSHFEGGAAALAFQVDSGFDRGVTCTVALTTVLVATTGKFFPNDVGAVVSGAGITAGTTIASYTDSTHVVMSAVGTVAATAVAVTIEGK